MTIEVYSTEVRVILQKMFEEIDGGRERAAVLEVTADRLTTLHADHAHLLFHEVLDDARTRLDARLSPDPMRQTMASMQSTAQDVQTSLTDMWKNLWK